MKRFPVLALTCISLLLTARTEAFGDDNWSDPVNGLRGRLVVVPAKEKTSPFCRVFIEFENTSNTAGQKKIRFSPEKLALKVTDQNGKEVPSSTAEYDGLSPLWEPLALPHAGNIKFQISFPGLGYRPGADKTIVDIGPANAWVIPQDGTTYSLSGSFSCKRQATDHPSLDWSGTLQMPKVKIPAAGEDPGATPLAPKIEPLKDAQVGLLFERIERREKIEFELLCQALLGHQTTLRAQAASLLGDSDDKRAIPFLIDALSDESSHDGANYADPGDATTRHRANKGLKKLTGQDFGFVWNAPNDQRQAAIRKWIAWFRENGAK